MMEKTGSPTPGMSSAHSPVDKGDDDGPDPDGPDPEAPNHDDASDEEDDYHLDNLSTLMAPAKTPAVTLSLLTNFENLSAIFFYEEEKGAVLADTLASTLNASLRKQPVDQSVKNMAGNIKLFCQRTKSEHTKSEGACH